MDTIMPFVTIAFAYSAYVATRRITQRHDTIATNEPPVSQPNPLSESEETVKGCVICGTEGKDDKLLKAPCDQHFVCAADIESYFEHATNDESLFPPRCCNQVFLLQDYEHHVPAEIASAYKTKAQGEYTILAKDRVYCANSPCSRFLHPAQHIVDPQTDVTYAVCKADSCGKRTCVHCKTLLHGNTLRHPCGTSVRDDKFQQIVFEKGYQKCVVCGATVELTEACNHITCLCGASFCYICGKPWPGPHGCPLYGPAIYDALGYNQDGFHRLSGLDAQGLTRRERRARERQQNVRHQHYRHQAYQPEQQEQQHVPVMLVPQIQSSSRFSALPRIGLLLCVFLLPRTSLAVRMGFALCVSLVPPLSDWVPGGFGHEYDRYEDMDEWIREEGL